MALQKKYFIFCVKQHSLKYNITFVPEVNKNLPPYATTFLCSGGKLEGEVGGVATLEGMQPSPSYLNNL